MLVLMTGEATREDIQRVKDKVAALGFIAHEIPGASRVAIGITGNKGKINPELFSIMHGVEEAVPVTKPYKLVGRAAKPENSEIDVDGEIVGGQELAIIAGPCSVENWDQLIATAEAVKEA